MGAQLWSSIYKRNAPDIEWHLVEKSRRHRKSLANTFSSIFTAFEKT